MNIKHNSIALSAPVLLRRLARLLFLSPIDVPKYRPIPLGEISQLKEALAPIVAHSFGNPTVDIQLTDRRVYIKQVELPRSARKKAPQVLQLQAETFGKSTNSQTAHCFVRLQSSGQTDHYHQIFAHPSDIEQITEIARSLGVRVRSIFCISGGQKAYFEGDRNPIRRTTFYWWFGGLLLVNVFLIITLFSAKDIKNEVEVSLQQARQEIATLELKLSEEQLRSVEISSEQAKIQTQVNYLGDHLKTTRLITHLTEQLTQDTWIFSLVLNGDFLNISGRTKGDPLQLIDALDGANWVKKVAVESPLQRDDYLSETLFDLKLTIDRTKL